MSMEPLDQRKRIILRAVILEYVADGEPVGSELISQKYDLGVKSATVRHELAEMSELGYLEQPHTSAGRIPSDGGYRYYVDNMVETKEPDGTQRQRVTEAAHRSEVLRNILHETTKTLSRMTHQLAAATTSGNVHLRVRNAVLTALGPQRAMLVLVFSNGNVENRMVDVPTDVSLEDIGRLNEVLPALLNDLSAKSLSKLKAPAATGKIALDKLMAATCSAIRAVGKDLAQGQFVVEGEEYILAQPEMQRDSALLREVLSNLEDEEVLAAAIQNNSEGPMLITIGRENQMPGLQSLSILRHSFFVGPEEAGTIAIIGTTRQDYESGISLLRFTAEAIGQTLSKILPK